MKRLRIFILALTLMTWGSLNQNNTAEAIHVIRGGEESFGDFMDEDNYFSTFLTYSGLSNMIVNGASTPVDFAYTVPADTRIAINRGFLLFEDGAAAFAPAVFGALGGALTNGIEISITPDGGSKVVLETWTTNREVRGTMFDFDQTFKTNGVYTGRWTFTKDLNQNGLILNPGDMFTFKIQDNLSTLDYFGFRLKGIIQEID